MKKTKVLVLGATEAELAGLAGILGVIPPRPGVYLETEWEGKIVVLLCSGIGMVNTSFALGKFFAIHRVDWALQFGIGGAFPKGPKVGEVVEIQQECYADLGAESPEGFLDLEAMGFRNFALDGKPIYNSFSNPDAGRSGLRMYNGITVNRVHGKSDSIEEVEQIWNPDVESMEGAAFMQVCLLEGIPCTEIRGISNRVEVRNRSSWELSKAVGAATKAAIGFLKELS